jgi:hypothetical protein
LRARQTRLPRTQPRGRSTPRRAFPACLSARAGSDTGWRQRIERARGSSGLRGADAAQTARLGPAPKAPFRHVLRGLGGTFRRLGGFSWSVGVNPHVALCPRVVGGAPSGWWPSRARKQKAFSFLVGRQGSAYIVAFCVCVLGCCEGRRWPRRWGAGTGSRVSLRACSRSWMTSRALPHVRCDRAAC